MAGERAHPSPQPGDRPPASGPLAVLQAFINTRYDLEHDHGAEVLGSPRALERWLRRAELLDPSPPLGEAELERALELREAFRSLALGAELGGEAEVGRLDKLARCSMSVCGSREKARAHYRRRRGPPAPIRLWS